MNHIGLTSKGLCCPRKTIGRPVVDDNEDVYNCDTLLFLGSKSTKTNKEIAKLIGKATVRSTAVTESKGSSGFYSKADQIFGRYLIDPAEIGRLERDECLVIITGLPPFKSKKYDVTRHPRWLEISS